MQIVEATALGSDVVPGTEQQAYPGAIDEADAGQIDGNRFGIVGKGIQLGLRCCPEVLDVGSGNFAFPNERQSGVRRERRDPHPLLEAGLDQFPCFESIGGDEEKMFQTHQTDRIKDRLAGCDQNQITIQPEQLPLQFDEQSHARAVNKTNVREFQQAMFSESTAPDSMVALDGSAGKDFRRANTFPSRLREVNRRGHTVSGTRMMPLQTPKLLQDRAAEGA